MCARFCFVDIKLRTASYYFFLELEIFCEEISKRKKLWLSVNERKHNHAEAVLKLGVLIESVQRDLRICVAFKLYYDSYSFAVGLISNR